MGTARCRSRIADRESRLAHPGARRPGGARSACRAPAPGSPAAGRLPAPLRRGAWSERRPTAAVALLLALCAPALGQSPRDLIQRGNEHFAAGRYSEALEAYQQVPDDADLRLLPELLHNRAAARFKLGQTDEARELWVRAAGLRDAAFEARARYNLGNCDYADALAAMQRQDAGAAIERLDRAIAQYRDALRLSPGLADARANLELAAQLKKQIEQMAQQQPQSQPSPRQEQETEQKQQQGQSSSQPSTQPDQSQPPPPDQDRQTDAQQQSQQQQQSEQEQQPSTQPQSQPAPQSQPTTRAAPAPEEEQPQVQPAAVKMTREEAERLLQMIRDAQRQRRAMLQAREAAKHKPVDRDW